MVKGDFSMEDDVAHAERIGGGAMRIERAAREGTGEAADWIETLARFGYAAKGAVYLLVGWLALQAAIGSGGATGSDGALRQIAGGTAGSIVLGLIAIGLAGYVVWQLVAAIANPDNDSTGRRALHVIKAVVYGGLAVESARLALSGGGGGGGGGAEHWTAQLMQAPAGVWLVGAVGAGVLLYGIQQLVRAWRADLDDELRLHELDDDARRWVVRISRFGLAARGIVLGLIGGGIGAAALRADPDEARGLGGALRTLQQQPWGAWLLGVVAAGLVAYGLYQVVRAKYRRIEPRRA